VTTRVSVWILIAIVATLVAGCGSTSGPGDTEDTGYPERTTPDNVLTKIERAFRNMDCDAYMDCLAEDFLFCPSYDQNDPNNPLPPCWDRETEREIHEDMFGPDGGIAEISLDIEAVSVQFQEGPDPYDPTDDAWHYVVDVDLEIVFEDPDHPAWYVVGDSEFRFRADPDTVSSSGELLWDVTRWYDTGPPPALPDGASSLSELKSSQR